MKKEISSDLLKKYLEGACSRDEEATVDEWYSSFDGKISDDYPFVQTELEEKLLSNIKNNIPRHRTKRSSAFRSLLVAASISIFLLVSGWFLFKSVILEVPAVAEKSTSVVNKAKVIQRVALEDGSVVWLKPDSEIEYDTRFSGYERRLRLKGEAFFVVAKDPLRPFVISTNNVETQVLGTSFNIKAYEESAAIEVEVLTGKVSVKLADTKAEQRVFLTPNEKATYLKAENQLRKHEPEKLPELAIWKTTNISFDNVPVRDVIQALNSAFDVRIQASNKNLLNCHIRADFTDQNLPDILELLSKSIEASYEFRDNAFYLTGEGCSKSDLNQ